MKSITPTEICTLEASTTSMVFETHIGDDIQHGKNNGTLEIMMRLFLRSILRNGEN